MLCGSLLFRTFPKVEKLWTGLKHTNVAEGAKNEVKKKKTKNKISPKYLADLMSAVFEEYQL